MTGHGSPPPDDKAHDPKRKVPRPLPRADLLYDEEFKRIIEKNVREHYGPIS